MAIEYVRGDIFRTPGVHAIGHGVNLHGLMGAGIAGTIARKFPEVKRKYVMWCNGMEKPKPKLGDVFIDATQGGLIIFNMATQHAPGPCAQLEAVDDALTIVAGELRKMRDEFVFALPAIGCGIGGLEWAEVKPLIEKHLGGLPHRVLVFEEFVGNLPAEPSTSDD